MLSFYSINIYGKIYYDKNVTSDDKFFYQNYGARIWPRGPPPEFNVNYRTFQKGPNPGGEGII